MIPHSFIYLFFFRIFKMLLCRSLWILSLIALKIVVFCYASDPSSASESWWTVEGGGNDLTLEINNMPNETWSSTSPLVVELVVQNCKKTESITSQCSLPDSPSSPPIAICPIPPISQLKSYSPTSLLNNSFLTIPNDFQLCEHFHYFILVNGSASIDNIEPKWPIQVFPNPEIVSAKIEPFNNGKMKVFGVPPVENSLSKVTIEVC